MRSMLINLIHRLAKFADKLNPILGGNAPDQVMEDEARLAGMPNTAPRWYIFIMRWLGVFIVLLAFMIAGYGYFTLRDKRFLSFEGLQAGMYFAPFIAGAVLLPLMLIAGVQRKINFRNTLDTEQRQVYDTSIKKRIKDFTVLFTVTLLVTLVFSVIAGYWITRY